MDIPITVDPKRVLVQVSWLCFLLFFSAVTESLPAASERAAFLQAQWNYNPFPPMPPITPLDVEPPPPPRVYPPVYSPPAPTTADAESWPYTDAEIRQNVENALASDSLLHPTPIRVEVNQGVVTLKGFVESWQDFARAEADAYGAGARQVRNLLVVRRP